MKLLILCQESLLREGLELLLSGIKAEAGVEVTAVSESGLEGIALAKETHPDVAVVDLHLQELNGIDTTRRLVQEVPGIHVLMLAEDLQAESLNEALDAGALGFITKQSDGEELERALLTVSQGKTYLCPDSADVLVRQQTQGVEDPVFGLLTERERQVLQLLAEGYGSKEVGDRLHISSKTVDTHRQHIMEKLDTDNLPDLVKYAIRAGLTNLDIES